MRVRSLAGWVIPVAMLLLPSSVQAISYTGGADLNRTSDAGFGCETQFLPGYPPDFTYQPSPFPMGHTSCTMWSYTSDPNTKRTLGAPATGTVTKVRVKSGSNPAPLRAVIIRNLYQTNPNNPNEITDQQCCTTQVEGPTFQPARNTVSETVVNLPVQQVKPQGRLSGWGDLVAVTAVGPGELPLSSTGPHTSNAYGAPMVEVAYPRVQPGQASGGSWSYPNYQPLIQFDWTDGCPGAAGAKARASQCSNNNNQNTNKPNAAVKAPFSFLSKSLRLKKGKVKVSVRCTAAAGQRCKGRVGLRTRAKKPKALASRKVNVKGGRKATVTLSLSRKARRLVRKKRNKVTVTVNLGAAGTGTKNVTLKR